MGASLDIIFLLGDGDFRCIMGRAMGFAISLLNYGPRGRFYFNLSGVGKVNIKCHLRVLSMPPLIPLASPREGIK